MPELRPRVGRDGGQPEPPYVAVAGDPDDPLVRAALAGIEEEGVPSRVVRIEEGARPSARRAARTSPLEVGLAVVDEAMCLTHAKFAEGHVVTEIARGDAVAARRLGHDAARIVLSVPLHSGEPSRPR